MLRYITRGPTTQTFDIEKKLFVYDAGVRDGTMDYHKNDMHSGVRATVFGATGTNISIQALSGCLSVLNWAWPTVPSSSQSPQTTNGGIPNTFEI